MIYHRDVDDSTARTGPTWHQGRKGYLVALAAGVPVALTMLGFAVTRFAGGDTPDAIVPMLGVPAGLGSVLAFVGMRMQPQRFRGIALLLTLIPAAVIALGLLALAGILFIFVTTSGSGS